MIQFDLLPCPPPPQGHTPGDLQIFSFLVVYFPIPGHSERADIFACLFLGTKCEIQEHPQTGTLTQGYKNSTRQQHFTFSL